MFTRIARPLRPDERAHDRRPAPRLAPRGRAPPSPARRPARRSTWPPAPATSRSTLRRAHPASLRGRRRLLARRCCGGAATSCGARGERAASRLAGRRRARAALRATRAFACVMSAFLLRNLADLERGLRGDATGDPRRAAGWSRSRSRSPALPRLGRRSSAPTSTTWCRAIGALVGGDREAYTYLPQSVDRFVTPAELARA